MTVSVEIQYCGSWGYGRHANSAKQEIERAFLPSDVSVTFLKDSGTTGNFEIRVSGELIHSKKTKGQGFLDTEQKIDAVWSAIEEAGGTKNANVTPIEHQEAGCRACMIL
jgi:selT/selW/selH-like putative selenoprotein